jgi:hypothetical protein
MNRRHLLAAAGSLASLGLSGCTGGGLGDDESGGNGEDGPVEPEFDVFGLPPRTGRPSWYGDQAVGHLQRIDSASAARGRVESPASVEGLDGWLSETQFDEAMVLHAASVGPDTCYGRLEVGDLIVENGVLIGDATATASGEDGCSEAETYAGAFLRVTSPVPASAEFRITDGWGETERFQAV